MSENGRLTALVDIPGGRLEAEAGANWLALRNIGGRELGIWISPLGPRSSYRTYEEQEYFWRLYQSGKGNLAARPGTSNHGWGRAVDLAAPAAMRRVIDGFGGPFGWYWGEVTSESWHVTYRGGGRVAPGEVPEDEHPSLKEGDTGPHVERVQRWLRENGSDIGVDGSFGPATRKAVNDLYRGWGHEPHGRFGDVGWSIVEGRHPWRVLTPDERRAMADLYAERRTAKKHGGWDQVDPSHRRNAERLKAWLVGQRKEIWRAGRRDGWKKHNRRRRYELLAEATR